MADADTKPVEPAGIETGMPNHVGSEADLTAALAEGDADIAAGRTLSFAEVAEQLRRNYAKA